MKCPYCGEENATWLYSMQRWCLLERKERVIAALNIGGGKSIKLNEKSIGGPFWWSVCGGLALREVQEMFIEYLNFSLFCALMIYLELRRCLMKTVLLHGLGQTAQDWKEVVQQLSISDVDCPEFFLQQKMKYHIRRFWGDLEQRYSEVKRARFRICGLFVRCASCD